MEKQIKIALDMDGVVMDWEGAALELINKQKDFDMIEKLKNGYKIEDLEPRINDLILTSGSKFWSSIEPLPWAKEMYNRLDSCGNLFFLTSPGSFKKRGARFLSGGCQGKLETLEKYFPNSEVILGNAKYFCADSNTILIDDNEKKIKNFIDFGGHGFLWPNQYKLIIGEVKFEDVMKQLERTIYEIQKENQFNSL